jgi:hypothetical protein
MRSAIVLSALLLVLSACHDEEAEEDHSHHNHGAHMQVDDPFPFQAAPDGAAVAFAEPADGATLTSPIHVVMAVTGIEVKAAGEPVPGTGHHHLIVDGSPIPSSEVVPKDERHIHFGDGSTVTDLELAAGQHTLTLQLADGMHRSYGGALATTITVTVE